RTSQGPAVKVVTTNTLAVAGVWQHVAAVYDGSNYLIYVNGVVQSGSPFLDQDNEAAGPGSKIGSDNQIEEPFDGLIDEVEIFNRALSAAEILAIYNAGSAGKCKCPVNITQ